MSAKTMDTEQQLKCEEKMEVKKVLHPLNLQKLDIEVDPDD